MRRHAYRRPGSTVPSQRRASRATSRATCRSAVRAPAFEPLEGRALFSVFTVTNTLDAGAGSLRKAIADANATANRNGVADVIAFNIPGAGVKTIAPTSALPAITEALTIDGYTQPGAAVNSRAVGTNATLLVELNGANAPFPTSGIAIAAPSTTVRGLVVNRFQTGIDLSAGAAGAVVEGNYLGTDATGNISRGGGTGLRVHGGASNNLIGGPTLAARNVISGNGGEGMVLADASSVGNTVAGNYIGLAATGTARLGNSLTGILIDGAPGTTIGGTTAAARNVISGNAEEGVLVVGSTATGVRVQGNFIGTDARGTAAAGNFGAGVAVGIGAHDNFVGGAEPGAGNVISANVAAGVGIFGGTLEAVGNLVQGNLIGIDATGTADLGNGGDGVVVESPHNTIGGTTAAARNVVSGNGGNGVRIATADVVVQGNFIGTSAPGTAPVGNSLAGVALSGTGNTVGGAAAGAGNVVSANGQDGVFVDRDADNNLVQGNRIGTDAAGAANLGNKRDGVRVANALGTAIGGAAVGTGNLISGNGGNGVNLAGALTISNRVEGNLIGTDAAGSARLPNTLDGVALVFASGNVIGGEAAGARNVISGNDGNGVSMSGFRASGNVVAGNLIGTNAAGTGPLDNGGDGVRILNAQDNRVGGTTPAARNVISGNRGSGVAISGLASDLPSHDNRVQGNFIGTNAAGTAPLPNVSHGVELGAAAVSNVIGGTTAGAGNVISGNHVDGISLAGGATAALANSGNTIQGNFVGTNVSGAAGIANGRNGISLFEHADDNTIGGTTAAARNVISGNLHNGVALFGTRGNVIQGNFIGADAAGTGPLPNAEGVFIQGSSNTLVGGLTPAAGNLIAFNGVPGTTFNHGVGIYTFGEGVAVNNAVRLNSIFANGGMGIDLADNRVTANDSADADAGENNRQNFPILTSASTSAGGTAVSGVLNSTPNTTFFIDFYANSPADSAAGATAQGRTYLGTVTVTTDVGGNAAFNPTFATTLGGGSSVTATATTINESPFGNTSEFSAPVSLPSGPAVAEVYVRGSAWAGPDADAANLTFKEFLKVKGLGDEVFGFRADTLPDTATLPWINMDEVVLRFAGPLGGAGLPQPGTITLRGDRAGGDYAVQSVTQLDARTVVLRLDRFLGQLAGGGEDGVRVTMTVPGAGAGGSSFALRLNVLQGDVDRNGSVLANDFSAVKKKFFKNTNSAAAGNDADYSPFHDVDSNGTILANDFSEVKKRFFDSLPPATSPAPVRAVQPAGITGTLFGTAPIEEGHM